MRPYFEKFSGCFKSSFDNQFDKGFFNDNLVSFFGNGHKYNFANFFGDNLVSLFGVSFKSSFDD
jgi:hypothetical protein